MTNLQHHQKKRRECKYCGGTEFSDELDEEGLRITTCEGCGYARRESKMYAWDAGLDFMKTRTMLEGELTKVLYKPINQTSCRESVYLFTLYVQLVNATRISEAFEFVCKWAFEGLMKQEIRVRKRSDYYERLIILPPVYARERFMDAVRTILKPYGQMTDLEKGNFLRALEMYSHRKLKYNTHAERYAGITHLTEIMNVTKAAKVTGHKKLDFILGYTTKVAADKDLETDILGASQP